MILSDLAQDHPKINFAAVKFVCFIQWLAGLFIFVYIYIIYINNDIHRWAIGKLFK